MTGQRLDQVHNRRKFVCQGAREQFQIQTRLGVVDVQKPIQVGPDPFLGRKAKQGLEEDLFRNRIPARDPERVLPGIKLPGPMHPGTVSQQRTEAETHPAGIAGGLKVPLLASRSSVGKGEVGANQERRRRTQLELHRVVQIPVERQGEAGDDL